MSTIDHLRDQIDPIVDLNTTMTISKKEQLSSTFSIFHMCRAPS